MPGLGPRLDPFPEGVERRNGVRLHHSHRAGSPYATRVLDLNQGSRAYEAREDSELLQPAVFSCAPLYGTRSTRGSLTAVRVEREG